MHQRRALIEHIFTDKLQSLLELGSDDCAVAEEDCRIRGIDYLHARRLNSDLFTRHFDLAIIHLGDQEDEQSTIHLVGRVKNQLSQRILVICPKQPNYFENHYLSLGFIREKSSNSSEYLSYSYNLETYNRKRDWNNARNWANPQHWHKRF